MPGLTRALETLRAGGRRLYRFCERLKDEVHQSERRSERIRKETIRNERRASRRALVLLLTQLNPKQRQDFRTNGYFHVIGGRTGDRYRIRVGTIANIDVLRDDGVVKHRLCARLVDDVPAYDVMAAQLLHLQDATTELKFLRQANFQSTLSEDYVSYRTTWNT
jgi:hypothetical protein